MGLDRPLSRASWAREAGPSRRRRSRSSHSLLLRRRRRFQGGVVLGALGRGGDVAGRRVTPADRLQARGDVVALVDGERAAGAEATAGGGVDDDGRVGLGGGRVDVERGARVGDGGQEQLGVGVAGAGEDVLGGAGLDDVAAVHDGDPVGEVAGAGDVVGDVEDGDALGLAQVGHDVEQADADGDVEHGDGFVGEDQFGAVGEGLGEADALALAAGEFVREAGQDVGGGVRPTASTTRSASAWRSAPLSSGRCSLRPRRMPWETR